MEETSKKTLLDYNLFEVIGLELEPEDQLQIEAMIYRSSILELLENELQSKLSSEKYETIEQKLESVSNLETFLNDLKSELAALNLDFELLFNPILEKVEIEFINDQLAMLFETANKLENQTEKELKTSLCNTIKNSIEEKNWEEVTAQFKKINSEIHQV